MAPRVAIYARISEDRSGEGVGVARQVADCQELAAARDLEVIKVFEENDTSAYGRKPRPQWRQLIALAERGEIDGIVAWHTDRLYRRLTDLEEVIDLVQTTKIKIYTVSAGDLDLSTGTGITVAGIVASIAGGEVRRMGERIARAHRAKAERGEWKGGRRPWGYEADGVTVNEVEAAALVEAAKLIVAGRTVAEATRLIHSATGRPIARTTLRDVLTSYRIVGLRQYVPQAERDRRAVLRAKGHPSAQREPEPLVVDATWPAILDTETWHALRGKFRDAEQRAGRGPRPRKNLLAGLLVCGACLQQQDEEGRAITSILQANSESYICQRCGKVAIRKAAAEKLVIEKVGERLATMDQTLRVERSAGSDWQSEIEKLDAKERHLTTLWAEDILRPEAYREGLQKLKADRARITREEEEEHRRVLEERQRAALLPTWKEAEPLDKRLVIMAVAEYFRVDKVGRTGATFQPGRVSARWKGTADQGTAQDGTERLGADPHGELSEEERRAAYLARQARYNEKRRQQKIAKRGDQWRKGYRG